MGFGNVRSEIILRSSSHRKMSMPIWYTCNSNKLRPSTLVYTRQHSSTFVQTRLLSSTIIYTHLHLSSDSSILIYIRLDSFVTHLHSSKLVYIHLVTRLCFQNRFKTLKYDCCLRVSLKILFEPKETQNQTLHKSLCPEETGLPRCSPKWVFLETLQYSEEHNSKFIKKRLQDRCFPVNIAKSSRTNFFYRILLVAASGPTIRNVLDIIWVVLRTFCCKLCMLSIKFNLDVLVSLLMVV